MLSDFHSQKLITIYCYQRSLQTVSWRISMWSNFFTSGIMKKVKKVIEIRVTEFFYRKISVLMFFNHQAFVLPRVTDKSYTNKKCQMVGNCCTSSIHSSVLSIIANLVSFFSVTISTYLSLNQKTEILR